MDKELKMPQVGEFVRHNGKLISIENIQPPAPKPYKEYIFEEIEARSELRMWDEVLTVLGVLNDFYGLETSVETAIKEAKEYASERNIGVNSELEVVTIRVARQYRTIRTDNEGHYWNGYFEFKPLEWGMHRDLPEPSETIVWSSKWC